MENSLQILKNWAKIYHRPDYKTAIIGEKPHLHLIVTRVNYITARLWLANVYNKVNGTKGFVEMPKDKPNWLCMTRAFRREKETLINQI